MVSPIVSEEEAMSIPPWLSPMLRAKYFVTCSFHHEESSTKPESKIFCLDCSGDAFCSYCLIHHRDHRVVQIRRSSYHNVVRVKEIQKHIDISDVQTYVINSAKILFLNERPQLLRPQPRTLKVVTNNKTCEICCRNLLDCFRFCSLGCKFGGVKNVVRDLLRGSEEMVKVISPGTPPIDPNHRRRKGIPCRAPF